MALRVSYQRQRAVPSEFEFVEDEGHGPQFLWGNSAYVGAYWLAQQRASSTGAPVPPEGILFPLPRADEQPGLFTPNLSASALDKLRQLGLTPVRAADAADQTVAGESS